MTPIFMSVAEPGFIPWIVESEEEAQALTLSLLAVLRRTVGAAPIWQQHEFSQRAENILKRNRIFTWPDLHRVIDRSERRYPSLHCIPGEGALVLKEFAAAIFARKWGRKDA